MTHPREVVDRARALRAAGYSIAAIAEQCSVSVGWASKNLQDIRVTRRRARPVAYGAAPLHHVAYATSWKQAVGLLCAPPASESGANHGVDRLPELDQYYDYADLMLERGRLAGGRMAACPICAAGLLPSPPDQQHPVGAVGTPVEFAVRRRGRGEADFTPIECVWGVDHVVCAGCWSSYQADLPRWIAEREKRIHWGRGREEAAERVAEFAREHGFHGRSPWLALQGRALRIADVGPEKVMLRNRAGRWFSIPTVGACELAARGRLRTAEQARIEAEASRAAPSESFPLASSPAIRVLVQRTLPFLHLPPEAEELRPTAGASLWRRLAAIAKHKLGKPEWADALNANVNLFLRARSDLDRATAGLLIYLMTVRNPSPFCKPIVNAAWSGRYEMVFEPLIDDWYDADAIVKPYWLASQKAKLGKWWLDTPASAPRSPDCAAAIKPSAAAGSRARVERWLPALP